MDIGQQALNGQREQTEGHENDNAFTIETAVPSDAAAISSLVRRVWPVTFEGAVSDSDREHHLVTNFSVAKITSEIEMSRAYTFVARTACRRSVDDLGQVLGYIQCQAAPASLDYGDVSMPMLQLRRVFVDVPYQSMGIGRALLEHTEIMAASSGFRTMTVLVWERNPRAQRFYTECGFEKVTIMGIDVGASSTMLHWQLSKLL